jgi:hypothetical protein
VRHVARSAAAGGQDEGKGHLAPSCRSPTAPPRSQFPSKRASWRLRSTARRSAAGLACCRRPPTAGPTREPHRASHHSSVGDARLFGSRGRRRTGRSCGGGNRGTKGPQQWNLGSGLWASDPMTARHLAGRLCTAGLFASVFGATDRHWSKSWPVRVREPLVDHRQWSNFPSLTSRAVIATSSCTPRLPQSALYLPLEVQKNAPVDEEGFESNVLPKGGQLARAAATEPARLCTPRTSGTCASRAAASSCTC